MTLTNTGNSITQLGSFSATKGDFLLNDGGSLLVSGTISGSNVSIGAGTIGIGDGAAATGSIIATGSLGLTTTKGGITLDKNGVLNGGTVDLASAAGVSEASSGTLVAGTLQSTGGVTNTVSLTGTANKIAQLGSFSATKGDFLLNDTGSLLVSGAVSGSNVSIGAGTIGIGDGAAATGSITTTGSLGLTTTKGGITLDKNGVLNGGTVDLSSAAGISEASTGTLLADTLQSTGGAAGTVSLMSNTNTIGTIGAFAVTGAGH